MQKFKRFNKNIKRKPNERTYINVGNACTNNKRKAVGFVSFFCNVRDTSFFVSRSKTVTGGQSRSGLRNIPRLVRPGWGFSFGKKVFKARFFYC
jgi:hypothetical protein